jgi:hypothetical protein
MKEGENPPVGLILCSEKGTAEAHCALDNLPNKVLAAEYQMVLPDEKVIADELKRSRVQPVCSRRGPVVIMSGCGHFEPGRCLHSTGQHDRI